MFMVIQFEALFPGNMHISPTVTEEVNIETNKEMKMLFQNKLNYEKPIENQNMEKIETKKLLMDVDFNDKVLLKTNENNSQKIELMDLIPREDVDHVIHLMQEIATKNIHDSSENENSVYKNMNLQEIDLVMVKIDKLTEDIEGVGLDSPYNELLKH